VKRVMWENGVLDPSCLEGADTGLHPRQIEAKGDYTAAHAYCRECGQRLGSHPTRSDDLYDEATR